MYTQSEANCNYLLGYNPSLLAKIVCLEKSNYRHYPMKEPTETIKCTTSLLHLCNIKLPMHKIGHLR